MKKFTLNVIMTLIMMVGMSLNVNAAPLYNTLEEAQKALDKGVHDANEISLQAMEAEVFEKLKIAIIDATAVWDSDRRNDIDEIEKVMPALLKAMEEAKVSVEKYKPLNDAIDKRYKELTDDVDTKLEELAEQYYEENEALYWALSEALEAYKTKLYDTFNELKSKADADMLAAAEEGKLNVDEQLKKIGIELTPIDDVVNNVITGIAHVVVAPSGNKAAYTLNGNKVSKGYKGIVIKGGKKIIMK